MLSGINLVLVLSASKSRAALRTPGRTTHASPVRPFITLLVISVSDRLLLEHVFSTDFHGKVPPNKRAGMTKGEIKLYIDFRHFT